jgi:hypothetical protein
MLNPRNKKIVVAIAVLVGISLTAVGITKAISNWKYPRSIRGVVLVQDSDPHKRVPIGGVEVTTENTRENLSTRSDNSGLFVLELRKNMRLDRSITLKFAHPQYREVQMSDVVQRKLYIVYLQPKVASVTASTQAPVKITDVRIRYTVEFMTQLNVGSAVKSFEVQNQANVACDGQPPCSPDGRWKATIGSASLDAGNGNEFQYARVSCIAGPCPFTRIENDSFRKTGQTITVSVRGWSDTTTFLLEAEVFRRMLSQTEHWSYPAIFGDQLSFTLPRGAESVSIEADVGGQNVIYPLGPALLLSWANCESNRQDDTAVYQCTVKPGYTLSR